MKIVFSQKIGISNKINMYIMNSYLIDVSLFQISRCSFFDMHDFHAILSGDSINI